MSRDHILRTLLAWLFYIGAFILLEMWFDDWRLGFCMLLLIAGNNLERHWLDK
jgi:hypothetical protein